MPWCKGAGSSLECPKHKGKYDIIIAGAGTAGLTAAALFKNKYKEDGSPFKIVGLEANNKTFSDGFAGRMGGSLPLSAGPNSNSFDMYLDLGGQYVSTNPSTIDRDDFYQRPNRPNDLLQDLLSDISPNEAVDFSDMLLNSPSPSCLSNCSRDVTYHGSSDFRWNDSTWYQFFADNIVKPNNIEEDFVYGCQVRDIKTSIKLVSAVCYNSNTDKFEEYDAEKVLVTASMQVLKDRAISFTPELPDTHRFAINRWTGGNGLKAWLEFNDDINWFKGNMYVREVFVPDFYGPSQPFVFNRCGFDFNPTGFGFGDGLYFFDETYSNPSSDKNVIGFFAHGLCADLLVRCSVCVIVDYCSLRAPHTYTYSSY